MDVFSKKVVSTLLFVLFFAACIGAATMETYAVPATENIKEANKEFKPVDAVEESAATVENESQEEATAENNAVAGKASATSNSSGSTAKATSNESVSTTSTSQAGVSSIRGAVTPSLLNAFDQLGFTIEINSSVGYSGKFSTSAHKIELRQASSGTLLHEMGHFLSTLKNGAAGTSEFAAIYEAEKGNYTGSNYAYVTQSCNEYFAESYKDYVQRPGTLQAERPQTYAYIQAQVSSISQSDIDRTRSQYGWAW